jgi:putative ABC transport system permease protein
VSSRLPPGSAPLAAWNLWRFIGLRHLTEKRLRSALTVLGVALGISLYLAIRLINQATIGALEQNVRALTGLAALTVTAGETGFDEAWLETIRTTPGVKAAVPLVQARASVISPGPPETLNVFGIDLLQESAVRTYRGSETSVDDFLTFLNQPDSIVVTKVFAQAHRLPVGSALRLMTAQGPRTFTVRGLLSPQGPAKAFGGAIAIMDIDGARAMFGKLGKIDRIDIAPTSPEQGQIEPLRQRLSGVLGPAFRVTPPEGQTQSMRRMVAAFQGFLAFVSSLALLIGLFMIANTISVSVSERRVEIGSLRALGTTRHAVLRLFLGEAAALGAFGGLIGCALARGFAGALGNSVAQSMSQRFLTEINPPILHWGASDLLWATGVGALVGAIAAAVPARRAASIAPIEAIRRSAESVQSDTSGFLVRLFALGLLSLVLLTGVLFWEGEGHPGSLEGLVQLLLILVVNLTTPLVAYGLFLAARKVAMRAETAVGRLALDNLLRAPKRTSGNILVLLVGLNLFVIISTVHHSFRRSIADWLDRVLQADLVVAASGGDITTFQTQPLDPAVMQKLTALPGIASLLASPPRGLRFVHAEAQGLAIALKAYDAPAPQTRELGFDLSAGDPRDLDRDLFGDTAPPACLVSTSLATRLRRSIGDTIALDTPTGRIGLRIRGIVRDFTSGDGVVILGRQTYRRFWRDDLVNLVYLRLRTGVDTEAARQTLAGGLAGQSLQILMNRELKQEVALAVDRSFAYLDAIEIAALTIALLALFNTLTVSVIERRRELGLLRAAGMSRSQLFALILGESAAQGVAAVLLSVLASTAVSYLWITHSLEQLLGWSVPFYFPISSTFWAGLLGVGVCLLAAVFPAWRAAFLPITEAIAYD